MTNTIKKSRKYEFNCCDSAENKAYDNMPFVVQEAIDTFNFISIRSNWDRERRIAQTYVCCKCNTCIERIGPHGGEFDSNCSDMSLSSIQDHLVSNGVIVNCKIDNNQVLSKNLVKYVKNLDNGIPNNATRVFWCDDHRRYFSYPHVHHCNDCHKGFASSNRIHEHKCLDRNEYSFKDYDFPPLVEDNKKMVNDMFRVTEAIENKYACCWDCQQTTIEPQQTVIESQQISPDGYQWCDASVPVTYMTPFGPQVFMEERMIFIRCM